MAAFALVAVASLLVPLPEARASVDELAAERPAPLEHLDGYRLDQVTLAGSHNTFEKKGEPDAVRGEVEVFARAADGSLWHARFDAARSGAAGARSGSIPDLPPPPAVHLPPPVEVEEEPPTVVRATDGPQPVFLPPPVEVEEVPPTVVRATDGPQPVFLPPPVEVEEAPPIVVRATDDG